MCGLDGPNRTSASVFRSGLQIPSRGLNRRFGPEVVAEDETHDAIVNNVEDARFVKHLQHVFVLGTGLEPKERHFARLAAEDQFPHGRFRTLGSEEKHHHFRQHPTFQRWSNGVAENAPAGVQRMDGNQAPPPSIEVMEGLMRGTIRFHTSAQNMDALRFANRLENGGVGIPEHAANSGWSPFQSVFNPLEQEYKSAMNCYESMSKSFLLVGGSSDIALSLASLLLNDGHRVTLLARDIGRCEPLATQGADVVHGDALDETAVQEAVNRANNHEGGLAGLAHLVGSISLRPPHATKLEDFEAVLRTNLTSAFLSLKLGGKAMLKAGSGRMVFTSSVAGSYGLTNHEAIAAAKGGLEAMVRAAASTYAQRGLRVNAVAPGLTETRLGASVLRSDAIREASVGMIPLKRINEPDEIARSMHWLLTQAPDNLTGHVLPLDGGMSALRG